MPIAARTILEQVAADLNDVASVRWTTQDLARFFNDGQRYITIERPDARHLVVPHNLAAGAEQTLPSNGEKLIDISHNTTGRRRAVTRTNEAMLDASDPNWRTETASIEIYQYIYDELEPKAFDVYPPALVGAQVQIKYAAQTVDIPVPALQTTTTAISGDMGLSDLFASALRNYVMFRCYSMQNELANPVWAAGFKQACDTDIGKELAATAAVSPKD
jgi:hypothetical protein